MDLKICRVCLDQSGSICVFDRDNELQYSAKIMRCANITITETDDLPKEICATCLSELTICYRFVEKCEAADRTLRALTDQSLYDVTQDTAALIKSESDAVQNFETYFSDTNDCIEPIQESSNADKNANHSADHIDSENKEITKKSGYKKKKKHKQRFGRIQCVVCGLMPSSPSALEVHMRTHTGESPYSCQYCDRRFKTKGSLKRHTTTNHLERERRFTCETCGNSFYTKSDIITHMRIHTNEKPYECSYCSKTFRQIASLIRHKRTHTGERPYSCSLCGRTFSDKTLVKKHQLVHTNEKKYSCHLCGQSVKTKTALNTHLSLHTNEKSNICSYCGMAFAAKGNLQNHIRRLHSEKSGQCSICLKTFKDLQEHMHKHTGEKPFNCANCNEAFASKRSLGRHMLFRHQNAGKFRCSIGECSKTFPVAMMLEFHLLKQHTNHTPFICPQCARGFYRTSDLSRHMRVSHGDTPRQLVPSIIDIKIPMKSVVDA